MNWKRSLARALPGTLVVLAGLGVMLLREPLADVYARRTQLNAFGLGAVFLLTIVAGAALASSAISRSADPEFRGAYSESTRLLALLIFGFTIITWIVIMATGAF